CTTMCLLPANSTVACPPLDVGFLGSLKRTLRAHFRSDTRCLIAASTTSYYDRAVSCTFCYNDFVSEYVHVLAGFTTTTTTASNKGLSK
ncbi:hypothetical protein PHYSODRAFT_497420, partial [Phytophthora sojae]